LVVRQKFLHRHFAGEIAQGGYGGGTTRD
jgi:hypothetical protein